MITDFNDKVAVVTGGAHGIGFSMARTFLSLGMKVVITARREKSLIDAAAHLNAGDRLVTVLSDAADEDANFALAGQVRQRFGRVNLLCLNAGLSRTKALPELSIEDWNQIIGINLNGPFYGVKAFLPLMEKEKQAHIVITSSVFAFFANALKGAYFAAKAGVSTFAECLYYDLKAAGSNISVTCVFPGSTNTNIAHASLTGDEDPELAEIYKKDTMQGTDPQVVTDAVVEGVQKNKFYLLPNTGEFEMCIDARYNRVKAQRNPSWKDVEMPIFSNEASVSR